VASLGPARQDERMVLAVLMLVALAAGMTALSVRHRRDLQARSRRALLETHGLLHARGDLLPDHPLRVRCPPVGPARVTATWAGTVAVHPRDPVLDQTVLGVRTGDRAFDDQVVVSSDDALDALLRLDGPGRDTVAHVLRHVELWLGPDGLRVQGPRADLERMVAAAREVARVLDPTRPLPALPERWEGEADGRVRSQLLAAALAVPELREQAVELARVDDHPRVHEVLATHLDDPDTLLQLFLDANDEALAERCFRRLRRRDPDGLAEALVDELFARGPTQRITHRLGSLRSPRVLPRFRSHFGRLSPSTRQSMGRTLLGLATASDQGPELASFAATVMAAVHEVEVWQEGLAVVREHGQLGHLDEVGPVPEAVRDAYRRTHHAMRLSDTAEALARTHDLGRAERRLHGTIAGHPVTVLLESPRVVVKVEGLPASIRCEPVAGVPAQAPFHARHHAQGELLGWAPGVRQLADRALHAGQWRVGAPRPGELLWEGRTLSVALVERLIELAQALDDALQQPRDRWLAHLLKVETEPTWICRWLVAAREAGMPAPGPTRFDDHPAAVVRACAAAWAADRARVVQILGEPGLADSERTRIAGQLVALGRDGMIDLLAAAPDLGLRLLALAPDTDRTAAAVAWWEANDTDAHQLDRVLALSVAAPHPCAEPLWCTALRAGRGPGLQLLEVMQAHGSVDAARALREVSEAGSGVWAQHCRRAYQALSRRLDVAGAVSLPETRGGRLAVADAGRGDLSEV